VIKSNSPNPDDILAALREVKVPGTNVDVVSIDLIGEITVNGNEVLVPVVRTTEKQETIEKVQAAVADRLGEMPGIEVLSVKIDDRSSKKKAPTGPHGQSADPYENREKLAGVQNVIAVASAKGGVGKSSVAVNLALALRDSGYRVGILDADIYGPSIPTMLGCTEAPDTTDDKRIIPVRSHGLQMVSMGLMLPPNQPVIWRGPMVFSAVRQFIKGVQWEELDYLVVDLPPGTGDAQLTLIQQVELTGIVMVTTPQEVALTDVRRGIQMFRQVDVPVMGIVENMSFFVCPDNGKKYDIFGAGGGARVAEQFSLPLLGEIPIDPQIRQGGDSGTPAVETDGSSVRAAFLDLAARVGELAQKRG